VDGDEDKATYEEAWYLAGAVVGLQALNTLGYNHQMYLARNIGMKMKAATCSLIFRKVNFKLLTNKKLTQNKTGYETEQKGPGANGNWANCQSIG